jgi:predicted nucleic acid-binding protein
VAVLVDTGPLVAAALTRDAHHDVCVSLLGRLRSEGNRLLVPATVVAEAGYLIERSRGPRDEAAFLESLADGSFAGVDLAVADYARMAELVRQYRDLPLGATDASLVALSERLAISTIATLDRRHFSVVRPRHIGSFVLLP